MTQIDDDFLFHDDAPVQADPDSEWKSITEKLNPEHSVPVGSDYLAVEGEDTLYSDKPQQTPLAKNPILLGIVAITVSGLLLLALMTVFGWLTGGNRKEAAIASSSATPTKLDALQDTTASGTESQFNTLRDARNKQLSDQEVAKLQKQLKEKEAARNKATQQTDGSSMGTAPRPQNVVYPRSYPAPRTPTYSSPLPQQQRSQSQAYAAPPVAQTPAPQPAARVFANPVRFQPAATVDPETAWSASGTMTAPDSGTGPEMVAEQPESPGVYRGTPSTPQRVAAASTSGTSNDIDAALALYDGSGDVKTTAVAQVPEVPAQVAQVPTPQPTPEPVASNNVEMTAPPERIADNPIPTTYEEQKILPEGTTLRARIASRMAWNENERPQSNQIGLVIDDPIKDKQGVVLIPAGSKANATITASMARGFMTAEVTSIQVNGREIAVNAGQMIVESKDGFLAASFQKPGGGGGVGRFLGNVANRAAGGMLASAATQFGSRGNQNLSDAAIQTAASSSLAEAQGLLPRQTQGGSIAGVYC